MKFVYCFLLAACLHCFASSPAPDTRVARAAFITQFIKAGDVGIEIGVASGTFSYHTLLPMNPSKLYLIDPWIYFPKPGEDPATFPEKQKSKDRQYEVVRDHFAPFENVEVIRNRSEDVAHLFDDNSIDYVYIDGEHSYDAVTRDLENYYPKVKAGGYLLGDDYGWKGIAPAVADFLERHKGECQFLNDDPQYGKRASGQYVIRKIGRRA